ncbi:MAG: hypothetical protein ACTS4X_00950 [Candidatus Hodgkinia cicadicola]
MFWFNDKFILRVMFINIYDCFDLMINSSFVLCSSIFYNLQHIDRTIDVITFDIEINDIEINDIEILWYWN